VVIKKGSLLNEKNNVIGVEGMFAHESLEEVWPGKGGGGSKSR